MTLGLLVWLRKTDNINRQRHRQDSCFISIDGYKYCKSIHLFFSYIVYIYCVTYYRCFVFLCASMQMSQDQYKICEILSSLLHNIVYCITTTQFEIDKRCHTINQSLIYAGAIDISCSGLIYSYEYE